MIEGTLLDMPQVREKVIRPPALDTRTRRSFAVAVMMGNRLTAGLRALTPLI
jgi:hypothetical protein